jgi:transposase
MSQAQAGELSGNGQTASGRPDPEVVAKARRRQFTAAYKLTVLREADGCTAPGEIGALLRREGLFSSHLTDWRRQREAGELAALAPKKRGRKSSAVEQQAAAVAQMQREIERLRERLRQAEAIIGAQKKLAELLGQPLDDLQNSGRP